MHRLIALALPKVHGIEGTTYTPSFQEFKKNHVKTENKD
jgi:hypothetical protein